MPATARFFLQHVLENGGSGFFARRIVEPLLKTRRLHVVAGAPEFSMPAYVVYPLDRQGDHVSSAIEIMHRLADAQTRQTADVPAVKRSARERRDEYSSRTWRCAAQQRL